MEEENKQEGVTFAELFKIILKNIWMILAISAVAVIVAVLVVQFAINPRATVYSLGFELNYPDRESMQYPDGTSFNYRDIISLDFLEAVKTTDEQFASIDTRKMLEENAISIVPVSENTENSNSQTAVSPGMYEISVKGKYFRDGNVATLFLRALGNQVIVRVNAAVTRFNSAYYLETYNNVLGYADQIDLLVSEKNYLIALYEILIETYGENYEIAVGEDAGRTLRSYAADVSIAMNSSVEQILRNDLSNNAYRLREDKDLTNTNIKTLETEFEQNEKAIDAIEKEIEKLVVIYGAAPDGGASVLSQFDAFHTQINTLVLRNEQIRNEITALQQARDETAEYVALKKGFTDLLGQQYDLLNNFASIYHEVAIKLYAEEAQVRFFTALAVGTGGTSVPLVAVATFVVVFIVASIVAYAVFSHKRKEAAEAAGNGPASGAAASAEKESPSSGGEAERGGPKDEET